MPIYLRVKIIPKSSNNAIEEKLEDGTLKIRIKSPPEKGKANKELLKLLSREYNVPKENIEIISGKTERTKLVRLSD